MLIDAPAVSYVLEAETQRQRFLSEDQAATYNINMKLAMGRTLTDKAKIWVMPGWIMNDVDLSTAPDIDWPEQPIVCRTVYREEPNAIQM